MNTLAYILAGLFLGLVTSLALVIVIGWVFPLFHGGAGKDAMTQGLTGTLVLFFSAPLLGILGCFLGYRKAKKKLGELSR